MGVEWDVERLRRVPQTYPAGGFHSEGIEALFYDGLPWRGEPTRIFTWLGMPDLEEGERCPGIVLVHGGGGTAFDSWVRLWNERGYAAIGMDLCGCVPEPQPATAGPERIRRKFAFSPTAICKVEKRWLGSRDRDLRRVSSG